MQCSHNKQYTSSGTRPAVHSHQYTARRSYVELKAACLSCSTDQQAMCHGTVIKDVILAAMSAEQNSFTHQSFARLSAKPCQGTPESTLYSLRSVASSLCHSQGVSCQWLQPMHVSLQSTYTKASSSNCSGQSTENPAAVPCRLN